MQVKIKSIVLINYNLLVQHHERDNLFLSQYNMKDQDEEVLDSCSSAFWSQVSASCIISGLSLTIRMQNSVSLSTPSPSWSPSLTIASASSLLIPSIPRSAEFLRRLSDVINPFSGSARRRNPPHNSDIKAFTSSLSAITGTYPSASGASNSMSWTSI